MQLSFCLHHDGTYSSNILQYSYKALDKREYLVIIRDNFCQFCTKTYVVTPHLNCLNETVQMRGHNIWFELEIRKIITQLSSNTPLI